MDEVARIAAALVGAIADASARVKEFGIDAQFRELVRHSREMHDLLVEAMIANELLQTEYFVRLERHGRKCDRSPRRTRRDARRQDAVTDLDAKTIANKKSAGKRAFNSQRMLASGNPTQSNA
jgi:hypothetical protein